MSAGLSREVLKWIQGLNLSYSIRNSKRDLANGFLVAEILSRFFPDVVHMHAYDTGTGTAAKKNNWDLLERAFVRIGIPVPRDYAADVAASKNDAGALVLSIIYTHIVKSGRGPNSKPSSSHGISISREHEDPTDWLMKPPPSRGGGVHLLLDQSPIHDPPLSHLLDPPSPVILPPPPLIPIPIPTPSPALPSTTRAAAKSPLKRGAGKGSYAAQRMNQITQQQGVGSSGAAGGSPSTAAGGAAGGNASVIGKEAILMANPKAAAMLLQGPSGDYGKEFEEHMGKVAVLKVLCSLLGVADGQLSFSRSSFPLILCREKLIYRLEGMDADEAGKVNGALMAKEREFLAILQHSPPSDLTMLLDTLLPCVTSFSSTSRVFIVGVQCMVFFGKLLHRLQPKDSFSRLLSAKEHVTLLSQVSAAHSQRIPFIARILDAFIGPGASDSERIRTLLTIKSFVNAAAAGQDTVNAQGGPNASSASGAGGASSNGQSGESPNAFVFLLCALETVRSKPVGPRTNREDGLPPAIPQPGNNNNNNNSNTNSQHITLILSECLTVINTHRRSASTGQIFGSAGAIMEMCAAIHLLSLLAESAAQSRHAQQSTSDDEHSPVTDVDEGRTPSPHRKPPSTAVGMIPDNVAGDVIDAEGKGLLRAVMHYDCPACLQKAYVRFLAGVLAVVRDGHPLVKAAREAAGGVLKWITDDVLRSALILIAPSLRYHPPLGAPFVRGLLAIDEPTRLQLLSLPPSTPTGSNPPLTASSLDLLRATAELHTTRFGDHVDLTWDLPFVERSTDAGRVVDGWWAFGVGMGLARVVKGPEKAGLTKEGLQILLAVLMAIVCPGKLQQTMGSNRGMNGTGGAHLEAPVKLEMLSMSEIPTIEELTSAAVPIATTTASRLPVLRKQTAEAGNDDPMAPWSHMYEFLIADLFVLVPNDETSELACCALEAFTRALPPESSLLNHLPLVVASMARLAIKGDQAVEKTPRERFVQWVVRWAKGGRETGGGWNCVVPVKEDVRKGVKRGMREVVGNFMKGFPGLCREHAEEWSVLVATATAG